MTKQTVNTDSTCPRPSIPSTCRPSSRAFRGGARTCRRSRCCSAPPVRPVTAHQRARVLSDGRSQRRHPGRHARPPRASRRPDRPLVILVHGLTGCEDSSHILNAARHLLDLGYRVLRLNVRGCGASRASLPRALSRRPHRRLPPRAVAAARRPDRQRHRRGRLFAGRRDAAEVSRRGGLVLAAARGGHDLRADRPGAHLRAHACGRATGSITTTS